MGKWLEAEGLSDLVDTFKAEAVSGEVLLTLSSDELKVELGVQQFGIRKLLLQRIQDLESAGKGLNSSRPGFGDGNCTAAIGTARSTTVRADAAADRSRSRDQCCKDPLSALSRCSRAEHAFRGKLGRVEVLGCGLLGYIFVVKRQNLFCH